MMTMTTTTTTTTATTSNYTFVRGRTEGFGVSIWKHLDGHALPCLRHYARAPFLSHFRLIALLTCQEKGDTVSRAAAARQAVLLLKTGSLENFSRSLSRRTRNPTDVPLISFRAIPFLLRSSSVNDRRPQ